MIADPLSRMVVAPAGVEDAMTNSEMVFGREAVCPLQPPEPGKKATTMTLSTHRVELESADGVWDGYDEALPALMMCEIPERYLHLFQTNTDVNTGLLLHSVLWSYLTTPHSVTKVSPAKLLFGVELRLPFDKTPNCYVHNRHRSARTIAIMHVL